MKLIQRVTEIDYQDLGYFNGYFRGRLIEYKFEQLMHLNMIPELIHYQFQAIVLLVVWQCYIVVCAIAYFSLI